MQHCLAVHWCELPAPPHPALALSMLRALSDRSSQCSTSLHVCWSLSRAEGAELGTANSTTQHKNVAVPTAQGATETFLLSPLLFCSSLHCCFLILFPLLLPLFPSITCLPHHHLLCFSVQVFRVSCPNPKTGCSYSSSAFSPGRKKFQCFNICSHPNSGRKTESRDSFLEESSQV